MRGGRQGGVAAIRASSQACARRRAGGAGAGRAGGRRLCLCHRGAPAGARPRFAVPGRRPALDHGGAARFDRRNPRHRQARDPHRPDRHGGDGAGLRAPGDQAARSQAPGGRHDLRQVQSRRRRGLERIHRQSAPGAEALDGGFPRSRSRGAGSRIPAAARQDLADHGDDAADRGRALHRTRRRGGSEIAGAGLRHAGARAGLFAIRAATSRTAASRRRAPTRRCRPTCTAPTCSSITSSARPESRSIRPTTSGSGRTGSATTTAA